MPALQRAAATLESLRPELPGNDQPKSESRRELQALARELRASGALIAHGLAVTQGTARLLAPAAGYRRDGEPAPLKTIGTLEVLG
jgi:hypothetical protein